MMMCYGGVREGRGVTVKLIWGGGGGELVESISLNEANLGDGRK